MHHHSLVVHLTLEPVPKAHATVSANFRALAMKFHVTVSKSLRVGFLLAGQPLCLLRKVQGIGRVHHTCVTAVIPSSACSCHFGAEQLSLSDSTTACCSIFRLRAHLHPSDAPRAFGHPSCTAGQDGRADPLADLSPLMGPHLHMPAVGAGLR